MNKNDTKLKGFNDLVFTQHKACRIGEGVSAQLTFGWRDKDNFQEASKWRKKVRQAINKLSNLLKLTLKR